MNIKTVHAVYFSGTGTTEKVVTTLAKDLAERLGAGYEACCFNLPEARKQALSFGPEDLAVVGYDDSTACALTEPELTSVHIDCRQMGLLCVERLKAVLCGEEHVPRLTVVPTRLVVRRSS